MSTTCVVFGGSGFIGSHLTARLVSLGWRVVVADIKAPSFEKHRLVEFQQVDVRKKIRIPCSQEIALVVNLAAIHRTPGHEPWEYYETNVEGARNVVDFCGKHEISRLWFTSSISVYGPCEAATSDSDPLRPVSDYGKSKQQAEDIHRGWRDEETGRHLLIVRPAAIFGTGENGNFTRLARSLQLGTFFYAGRRNTIKSCGYVEDLLDSLFFMEEHNHESLPYNFCYPQRYTIEQICETMAQVGGTRTPRGTIPLNVLLLAARVLHGFEHLTPLGRLGIHPDRVYKLFQSTNVTPDRLASAGFTFRGLVDGLTRWYEAEPRSRFV